MILGEILYLDGLGDGTTGLQADPPSTASHDPRLFTNGSLDSSGFHDFKVEDWILTTYMFLYIFFPVQHLAGQRPPALGRWAAALQRRCHGDVRVTVEVLDVACKRHREITTI